jgi:hypothetical protein
VVERIGVSEADLRRLLAAVDPARGGDSAEFVPDPLLRDLPELFGCDAIAVQVVDPYLTSLRRSPGPQPGPNT